MFTSPTTMPVRPVRWHLPGPAYMARWRAGTCVGYILALALILSGIARFARFFGSLALGFLVSASPFYICSASPYFDLTH